jgi:hypothetical protein
MLNDIQITSDYMSRWVVLKRRVGAVTRQRILKVLFYVNILQCFFVVEICTANAVSVAIGDNGNRLIFEIWWNFFYDLFSIKNVADVNSIDSFVSKRNMEEFSEEALQDINIEEYLKNPLSCDGSHSPFQYNPSGHVITGDLNII